MFFIGMVLAPLLTEKECPGNMAYNVPGRQIWGNEVSCICCVGEVPTHQTKISQVPISIFRIIWESSEKLDTTNVGLISAMLGLPSFPISSSGQYVILSNSS